VNPKDTWSGSLESYHPYLPLEKVSKIPKTFCIYNNLPKSTKTIILVALEL
jgi:hypothetical protein